MRIAVAGGTGTVGRPVVERAREAGHDVVVISRSHGIDLTTGAGLDEALRGVETVVDVSNVQTIGKGQSIRFFEKTTRNLLAAEERAGVRHHALLSIVGIDRVRWGYYLGKLRQEELVLAGPVPATVLRATQFFELTLQSLTLYPGPLAVVPWMRAQPVAAADVAAELLRVAEKPAAGRVPELAGPEVMKMAAAVRRAAKVHGPRKLVASVPWPSVAGWRMATGGLLPTGPGPRGTVRFEDWLAKLPESGQLP
ncbi:SDR family oxidoreductase [Paractinoplanes globisporus]|uniref:SDR family oxidoreductase n=1 Tax=Paractinoplanes globisporus TaxID=113565 RepID=A0ABW6W642_9ACTN|nr:NAD(P)H-binding protein [Actinoplanes globisporus]